MLELQKFEGVSSRDAAGFGGKEARDYWFWGWWAVVHDLLSEVWHSIGLAWRKRKVRRLRAELLPQYPNTLICPQCFHIIKRT